MNQSLHQTLLFASALQVLGSDHEVARLLERAVQTRDLEATKASERAIERLDATVRHTVLNCFERLWSDLPVEARAA